MVTDFMVEMVIGVGLIIATSFLFAIILLAYIRMRNIKLLLFSLGFGTFFVGAILHLPEIFIEEYGLILSENVMLLFQLVGLLFIAIGILKD
jgi:hypothetical protein